MNAWTRQIHRWLSIVFTLGALANVAAQMQHVSKLWIGLLALVPLILLQLSGLYLFVLPYIIRRRVRRQMS